MATELAKAYVQIMPSAQGMQGSLSQMMGGEAASAGQTAGASFGTSLVSKVKGILAAAGIGAALKAAIGEGAALEQSLGGIETLFKDSADTVKQYAANAYSTAGLSANAYMEAVTGFSASLLQGLDGDTAAAAEIANTALTDMSDNANKMGTDMESIQVAYQGFAKQNYTMLDNLKLGYGGTKTEMERLLADAQKISGVEYDINNLSDVYAAIHVIQGELDITGTTAKEASTTISGSLASMKAAFSNVLGSLTLGQDVAPAMNALADSVTTFLVGNLLPAVGNILHGLPGSIITFLQSAVPQLTTALATLLPQVLESVKQLPELLSSATGMAVDFITNLAAGLPEGIPALIGQVLPLLQSLSGSLRENAGTLIDSGINLILQLANGLIAALPDLIAYIPEIVINIAGIINDNAPKLLAAAGQLILMLIKGIVDAVPALIENFPKIIQAIVAVWNAFNWLDIGKGVITALGNGIKALAAAPGALMRNVAQSVFDTFKGGFSWSSLGTNIINGIISGIKSAIGGLVDAAASAAKAALDAAKNFLGIHSPSRVMQQQVGKFIPLGMAVGIEENTAPVKKAMDELSDMTTASVTAACTVDAVADITPARYDGGTKIDSILCNVYPPAEIENVEQLADLVAQRINSALTTKQEAFA